MDDEFRKFFEQQRHFEKLLEDAMGPSEKLRRQIESLLEPSPAFLALEKMRADVRASAAGDQLMEQVERMNQTLGKL